MFIDSEDFGIIIFGESLFYLPQKSRARNIGQKYILKQFCPLNFFSFAVALTYQKKKRFGFLQKLFFIDLEGREREIPANVPGKTKDGPGAYVPTSMQTWEKGKGPGSWLSLVSPGHCGHLRKEQVDG